MAAEKFTDDEPLEACYFDQTPVEVVDRDSGDRRTYKVLRMLRAQVKERDEATEVATLVVFYPDRRLTKTAVKYGPGRADCWGWPNDKGQK